MVQSATELAAGGKKFSLNSFEKNLEISSFL